MDSALRGVYRCKHNYFAFPQNEPGGLSVYLYPRKSHTFIEVSCDGRNELRYSFPAEEGEPRCARKNGEEYSKYVGLNLHDFRRSAVRNLIRSGVSQNVAMKVSGHRTPEVFRRYDIIDENDLADATEKIERSRQVSTESTTTDTKTDTPASDSAFLSPQIPHN